MSDDTDSIQRFLGAEGALIAGGGIAGLYAAWTLSGRGTRVAIADPGRDPDKDWGGKIQTEALSHGGGRNFIADFGPMRYELGLQPRLKALLTALKVKHEPFTGPLAPSVKWPDYNLDEDERDLSTPHLFRRGILLAIGESGDPGQAQKIIDDLWDEKEEKYAQVRKRRLRNASNGRFLRDMTLWNALGSTGVLSHRAIMKIRELGSFYHMIDENVNAAEWIVWWLRAFTTKGASMQTLTGGSVALTRAIIASLKDPGRSKFVLFAPGSRLTAVRENEAGFPLVSLNSGAAFQVPRLVMALPTSGLQPLRNGLPDQIRADLDTVEPYRLLKVFFVVQNPWWKPDVKPQTNAASTPTREIHYQRFGTEDQGMVMVYTDRPATSYWQNYVKGVVHDRPEIDRDPALLKIEFARYLAKEIQDELARAADSKAAAADTRLTSQACREFSGMSVDQIAASLEQRVLLTGIRDWGRAPYEAAYHAWKPGVDSAAVIDRMKRFGKAGRMHIVGEAYSSYHGFIEGALRSVELALPKPVAEQESSAAEVEPA